MSKILPNSPIRSAAPAAYYRGRRYSTFFSNACRSCTRPSPSPRTNNSYGSGRWCPGHASAAIALSLSDQSRRSIAHCSLAECSFAMASNPTAAGLERLSTLHGVFYAATDDLITRQLTAFGAHTRNELAMVLDHVREGEIFVDVGAHIGTFAIPIARKLGPRGKLLAIESSPDTHALLERNVGTNGLTPHIQTICAIAGQGPGRRLQRVEVGGNTGAGFFIPDAASACHAVDARWMICSYGFARLDFLKIDVEGMESPRAAIGCPPPRSAAPQALRRDRSRATGAVGATVAELDRFLRGFGYRFFRNTGERNSANDLYVKTRARLAR